MEWRTLLEFCLIHKRPVKAKRISLGVVVRNGKAGPLKSGLFLVVFVATAMLAESAKDFVTLHKSSVVPSTPQGPAGRPSPAWSHNLAWAVCAPDEREQRRTISLAQIVNEIGRLSPPSPSQNNTAGKHSDNLQAMTQSLTYLSC